MVCDTDFSQPINNSNLCQVISGPFEGSVTDQYGIIQSSPYPDVPAGMVLGTCDNNGFSGLYERLEGFPATVDIATDLLNRFDATPQSRRVVFDARASRRDVMCVAFTSQSTARRLLTNLRDQEGNLSETTRQRLRADLGQAFRDRYSSNNLPPRTLGERFLEFMSEETPKEIYEKLTTFLIFGPLIIHYGNKMSGPKDPPSTGGSSSGSIIKRAFSKVRSIIPFFKYNLMGIGMGMAAGTLAVGALLLAADDETGVGVLDDVFIPALTRLAASASARSTAAFAAAWTLQNN